MNQGIINDMCVQFNLEMLFSYHVLVLFGLIGYLTCSKLQLHYQYLLYSFVDICVAIQWDQSEVGSIDYEIQPEKKECISFVFYCFENLSIAITLEPLVRFRWGFQQNVPLLMRISIKQKTENMTCSTESDQWFQS